MSRTVTRCLACTTPIVAMFVLGGCVHLQPVSGRGHVAREWAKALRELQITPVFPPREDVEVGDIYIVPVEPEDEERILAEDGYLPRGMWIHSLYLGDEVSRFYSERRTGFPPNAIERHIRSSTERVPSGRQLDPEQSLPGMRFNVEQVVESYDVVKPVHPQPEAEEGQDIFTRGNVRRLRVVGFPMFMAATFRQGDLSSFFPSAGALAQQASFSKVRSVTVNVQAAESYGLPAAWVLPVLHREAYGLGRAEPDLAGPSAVEDPEEGSRLDMPPGAQSGHSPFDNIHLLIPAEQRTVRVVDGEECIVIRLRLSTEVFYARALDVVLHAGTNWASGLQFWDRRPVANGNSASTTVAPGSTVGQGRGDGQPASVEDIAATLEAVLNASRAAQGYVPGGAVRVLSANESHIGMRQVYDRPVAIGFRGFDFKVLLDPVSGRFLRMEVLGATETTIPRGD